ncbi:unnamed protein product, partial [Polarella glacialis]
DRISKMIPPWRVKFSSAAATKKPEGTSSGSPSYASNYAIFTKRPEKKDDSSDTYVRSPSLLEEQGIPNCTDSDAKPGRPLTKNTSASNDQKATFSSILRGEVAKAAGDS